MNIALVYGGFSGEAEVSRKSGIEIFKKLKELFPIVYLVKIVDTNWVAEVENKEYPIDKNDFSFNLNNVKISFDKVFNIIHGTPGEDGKLAAYFDLIGINHNSSGILPSSLTFNKNWCNRFLATYGIIVPQSEVFYKGEDNSQILNRIKFPCFIKPNNGGSSIGTHKAYNLEELKKATADAFKHDTEVIVEEFIEGREFSCGIFKNKEKLQVMPLTEIIPKSDFFDFNQKYSSDGASEITPAKIDPDLSKQCQDIVIKVFNLLRLKKVARIDFILKDGAFYLIEVNSIPGMSPRSILPQQALNQGIDFKELCSILIE